jgi:CubicO group peptidase (beta-lactamase class C family)
MGLRSLIGVKLHGAAAGCVCVCCNPGYALLGIVVERVSGKRFGDFLEQEIFKPVGMSNTFVYDSQVQRSASWALDIGAADERNPWHELEPSTIS